MVTRLLFQAAYFNQKISFYLPQYCIRWDHINGRWEYTNNWRKLFPHYCISFGFFGLAIYLQIILIIFALIFEPETLSYRQLFMNFLITGGMQIALLMDVIMLYYGSDLLIVLNWIVMHYLERNESSKPATWSGMLKLHNEKMDWYGFFAVYMVVLVSISSIMIPIFLVYEDSDPFFTTQLVILSSRTLRPYFEPILFYDNRFGKLLRFSLIFILSQIANTTLRTSTIVMMSLAQSSTDILHTLSHTKLDLGQTKLYRKLDVCLTIQRNMVKNLIAAYLGFSFVLILMSVITIVHGWKFLPIQVYLLCPIVLLTLILFLKVSFKAGCGVYETSSSVIESWNRQLHYRQVYLKRILKSFQPIAAPIGGIGIMDKDIKVNYVQETLGYAVNALVSTQDVFD